MRCTRLGTDFLFFLEVETSKERARNQKKDLNVYPFGLKHKGYNNTPLAGQRDHKYGFGGKEEQNELRLEWIDITARNYDPALGRWMNLDPLAESMSSYSPYNYAFDNPIYWTDPDGMAPAGPNDIIGLSKRSASRTVDIIQGSFSKSEHSDFRNLIKLGGDGKTFEHISQEDFDNATKNFNSDEAALAKGYFTAINDDKKHRVGVLQRNETIGNFIGDMNISTPSGTLTKNSTGADIDNSFGGGFNAPLNSNEDLTVIISDSNVNITDYRSTATRKYLTGITSSADELLAHETIGHGLTRYNLNNTYTQWVNAVRMTNAYLRTVGINSRYRDGSSHFGHGGVPGNPAQMTRIPDYLKP